MLAKNPSRPERRGIVLVLVLAMLGLLALIGVTFATFSGQSRINARNFAQSLIVPQDDELMDFALTQLINDTADPRSVIRGHSLARDMYGNDSNFNGYLPLDPESGTPFYIISAAASPLGTNIYTLNIGAPINGTMTAIASNDTNFYGFNFTRWIMTVGYNGSLTLPSGATPTPTGAVSQTFEVLADSGYSNSSSAARVLTVAITDTGTSLFNPNASANFPNGYLTELPGLYLANFVTLGSATALGLQFPFSLDGRRLHAFNGPGMGSTSTPVTINGTTINVPNSTYGNFRYNGFLGVPGPGAVGMDEDYDACDLENWFLAIQSADGQVTIPSFHRPGVVRFDPTNGVNDWSKAYRQSNAATFADSASRILRPVAADGHDALTFPDLIPSATTGKINYDVDNDGDGVTDSVWLDLGYPARRDSRGQLYKPLFAFMVIGLNGRIPLNTAGNLAGNSAGTGATHAEHLGNSASEVDPTYALQNAYDGSAADLNFAWWTGTLPAPNPNTNPDNSQLDTGNIDVRITQLRNLLAGTRPQPNPLPTAPAQYPQNADPNGATNGDDNFVFMQVGSTVGQPYFMPNGIAEQLGTDQWTTTFNDPGGNPQVLRLTQPVPGRWGEAQSIPGVPFINPAGNYVNLVSNGYRNPVRAGYSQDIGDTFNNSPRDAADDNFNSFDPYPPYDTVTAAQRLGEVDDAELYDAAGALLLPIDRMRRWLTPADINGTGSIRTWTTSAAGPTARGNNRGPDPWGRVEYFSYFRPPGAPGAINVNYTPLVLPVTTTANLTPFVPGTTLGATYYPSTGNTNFYNVGVTQSPSFVTTTPTYIPSTTAIPTYLPDITNNPLHGFESFKLPNLGGGYGAPPTGSPGNNRPGGRTWYDPQDFGGMPFDLPPPSATAFFPTGYPTYNFSVNSNPQVRSDGLNEADEMNLYTPNALLDSPFGPSDIEWLYRQQDVDGASLTSRLSQLAPISFTNGLDGMRRRRLFALDSWETNNFVWANDNPSGVFSNNHTFSNIPTATAVDPTSGLRVSLSNASFSSYGAVNNLGTSTPSLAQRDKKINLNYPLPVSNDPNEPIRQKWINETYQLLKLVLPPRTVDTPDELAQLGQFVTNIIDFRDPDCTMTHFRNPDVVMALGSISTATPAVYTPPKLFFANPTPATVTIPLDQFGMEYNPIAINEVLAYSFQVKDTTTGAPRASNRFFVELVNTLTQANLPAGATIDASSITLDNSNYDLVIAADDPVSRPDPFMGQLLPVASTGTPANYYGPIPLQAASFASATTPPPPVVMAALPPAYTPLTATPAPITVSPPLPATTSYFNVIGSPLAVPGSELPAPIVANFTLQSSLDPADISTAAPTTMPPTPPPGALTLDTTNPATIGGVQVGTKNAYPLKPWMAQVASNTGAYYWVCLRRPANPFQPPNPDPTGASGPYNPMIVVDSMRFPYIEGGGVGTPGTPDTVTPTAGGSNALYSAQRAQPYRGGHAVRLPGDTGTATLPALTLPLDTRYGYSEQTTAPTLAGLSTTYGQFGTARITAPPPNAATTGGTATTPGSIFHTLGKNNDNPEPWDWFVFNDRDFTSVAELMLVPGCPPGLFTKQFVELPPMAPSTTPAIAGGVYTGFPVPLSTIAAPGALIFPPVNPTGAAAPLPSTAVPAPPYAYSYPTYPLPAPTAPPIPLTTPLQPHTYPYLVDKFFYSGASLQATTPPFAGTDTVLQSVNTASSDGWFKMFEFFEVPSQMIGSIGSVASGTNFDWMRQDTKPGLLNLNLVIDEEVFFSILGRQTYNPSLAGFDQFTQTLLNFTQLTPANEANLIPQIVNTATATGGVNSTYSMLANGQSGVLTGDWLHPQGAGPAIGLVNNGMKAAFAQFLFMRHGSLNLFNFTSERPFHSLSYPDIDFTVMRPATLPLAAGATSNPPLTAAAATALAPYATTPGSNYSYAGDPGVRNPFLYPGGFASFMSTTSTPPLPTGYIPGTQFASLTAPNNYFVLPEPVPARRLFQVPDAFGQPTTYPDPTVGFTTAPTTPQSNASDSGDPFINVAQFTGALGTVTVTVGGTPATYFLNNGYPVLNWSGNATTFPPAAGATPGVIRNSNLGSTGGATNPDFRQHPNWRLEIMQRVMNETTVRTHQYAVWITVGFFEILKQGDIGNLAQGNPVLAFDTMGPEVGAVTGKGVRYRGFFLVDRTKLNGFNPSNTGSFRNAVVYRKVIQ